ncbi:FAD-binding and (Fe-S)-binding domain-containing protein [Pseudoclavibacter terrae]|uniref:FAD-binding oxidoreductase n=1 Tax=Pseudoclavibacter terrae TaxID=1530195 RepID=A0A7J5AXF7_9MICO|nr:FAD-binding and (Fe-S)-binding domain-containing protein [Pseudoclavibacter terrae]KAB1636107.1 FAD-binding oxidoreductase [Pseudoclavibacter terrae]
MPVIEERTARVSELRDRLGKAGISVDASEHRRQEYSYDASNYRVRPEFVVFPSTTEDLKTILVGASEADVPVTLRGGGTSMAGNAVGDGVVIDVSRQMTTVDEIDHATNTVWVDAGVVLGELRAHVERNSGGQLTFAPDPSSLSRATVGGSIGNDACGNHSVEYGRMSNHVVEIELLTIDGAHLVASKGGVRTADETHRHSVARAAEINDALRALANSNLAALRLELQTIPRQVSGYHLANLLPENGFNLARALAGTEGTCAIILRARVNLVTKPGPTALLCVGYNNTVDSARDVMTMLEMRPSAIEGLNSAIVDIMRHRRGEASVSSLPNGDAYVMVEFSADTIDHATEKCDELLTRLRDRGLVQDSVIATEPAERAKLWRVREDGAGLSSKRLDGTQTWPGWEDSAVAPENLADYLAELLPVIEEHGYTASMYGHFGAGCVHMRLDFELRTEAGRENFSSFMRRAAEIVVRHGGSLSGEHGDGRARSALLDLMYSQEVLELFQGFKDIWDPSNLLNPGIIVDPVPFTDSLSLQGFPSQNVALPMPTIRPVTPIGQGAFVLGITEADHHEIGTFVGNAHACIGVGRCRATSGGFMCPSYRATKDEKDSTRGRARVLQELARGQGTSAGGWARPEVREALDLCLSCKACSTDCPTGVDMAEAKSELIQDHYRGKLRPFTHYSIGWLPRWLPLVTRMSTIANIGAKIPLLRWVGEKLGISARRRMPEFSTHAELRKRVAEADFSSDGEILVFADSFTKAFRPEVIPAAARVLRSSGAEVGCAADACCGLTWISTGQRDGATKRLANLVEKLDDGTDRDIVVLEPSCAAAIRDDAPKLVGSEAAARVARRVRSFSVAVDEAMNRGWAPDALPPARAVVQTHCHEHAAFGSQSQRRVLSKWGVADVTESSSCCGVAGNFGFEAEHFDLSMQVAEHSIIPALKKGGDEALVLTDGFSCTMQVSQINPFRETQHLAIALDPNNDRDASPRADKTGS